MGLLLNIKPSNAVGSHYTDVGRPAVQADEELAFEG
jgi:hypothetical protein